MTSIRIVIASLLAAVAMLAGGGLVHHDAAPSASHRTAVAGVVDCCMAVTVK
jgi:hypothetical protein